MFKSKQVDPETNAVLVPAAMDHLDPLREHRFFCPWRNGAVQRNPGAKPPPVAAAGQREELPKAGWEVLVTVLKNDAFLRSRMGGEPSPAAAVAAAKAGHGRSQSSVVPGQRAAALPGTPGRPTTAGGGDVASTPPPPGLDVGEEEEEDEAARAAKDKERWARLRRVKSLFNTKGGSRLKRAVGSRPGTSGGRPETPSRPGTGQLAAGSDA